MRHTSSRLMSAARATIKSGNSRRIPNTAINIPMVRKMSCQNRLQPLSTEALTTALSKESDTSITHRIAATPSDSNAVTSPP